MITPYTIFQSFWIIMGLWMNGKLFWMVFYEFLERGDGEKYLRGELSDDKRQRKIKRIYEKLLQKQSRKT